ncbi:unnamed protein product, partial [Onchocerca ochengi]
MIMHSSICGRVYVCMYVRGLSVGLFKPGLTCNKQRNFHYKKLGSIGKVSGNKRSEWL